MLKELTVCFAASDAFGGTAENAAVVRNPSKLLFDKAVVLSNIPRSDIKVYVQELMGYAASLVGQPDAELLSGIDTLQKYSGFVGLNVDSLRKRRDELKKAGMDGLFPQDGSLSWETVRVLTLDAFFLGYRHKPLVTIASSFFPGAEKAFDELVSWPTPRIFAEQLKEERISCNRRLIFKVLYALYGEGWKTKCLYISKATKPTGALPPDVQAAVKEELILMMEEKRRIRVSEDEEVDGFDLAEPSDDDLAEIEEDNDEPSIPVTDSMTLYMHDIGKIPLLKKEEEVDLAKRIEKGLKANKKLKESKAKIKASELKELRGLVEDGLVARELLLNSNTRLVISVAKKYLGRGVPFSDLIQEGNLGLIKASKKFDYRRGFKFSTYATWWIRQAVTRAISEQSRTVRVPVHMGDNISRMYRVISRLTGDLGREPTDKEIADEVTRDNNEHHRQGQQKVFAQKVTYMKLKSMPALSLDAPMKTDDGDGEPLGEFIADDRVISPAEAVEHNSLKEKLEEVLGSLPPKEANILRHRYGLYDGEKYTLEEVGRKFGVTRERIRQIEAQALQRLRHPSIKRKLRDYLR